MRALRPNQISSWEEIWTQIQGKEEAQDTWQGQDTVNGQVFAQLQCEIDCHVEDQDICYC